MKYYHPLIFFLDDNLMISAQSLTTPFLEVNIKHVNQALWNSLFYYVGIRSKKAYDFYFQKDKKSESILRFFPSFQLKNSQFPKFVSYNSIESRWTRKCLDHFTYMVDYLEEMLVEYYFRTSRDHDLNKMLDFHRNIPINLGLSLGISIPNVNLKKIVIPWKNLAPQYRKKDIVEGYRKYYRTLILNPIAEYGDVKRDIPEWLFDNNNIIEQDIEII